MEVNYNDKQAYIYSKFIKFSNAKQISEILAESLNVDILERFSKLNIDEDYVLEVIKILAKVNDRKLLGVLYNAAISEEFMKKEKRLEMLKILVTADDGRKAYAAVELILKSSYDDELLLKIIPIIVESKDEFTANAARKIALESKIINHEKAFEIIKAIALLDGKLNDILDTFRFATSEKILDYENVYELINGFAAVKKNKRFIVRDMIDFGFDGNETSKIISIVASYKSLSRLQCASKYLSKEPELFSEIKDIFLETLEYFKDDEDECLLFACVELFSDEADPTIKREIKKFSEALLTLPKKDQIKVLKKGRILISDAKKR